MICCYSVVHIFLGGCHCTDQHKNVFKIVAFVDDAISMRQRGAVRYSFKGVVCSMFCYLQLQIAEIIVLQTSFAKMTRVSLNFTALNVLATNFIIYLDHLTTASVRDLKLT